MEDQKLFQSGCDVVQVEHSVAGRRAFLMRCGSKTGPGKSAREHTSGVLRNLPFSAEAYRASVGVENWMGKSLELWSWRYLNSKRWKDFPSVIGCTRTQAIRYRVRMLFGEGSRQTLSSVETNSNVCLPRFKTEFEKAELYQRLDIVSLV